MMPSGLESDAPGPFPVLRMMGAKQLEQLHADLDAALRASDVAESKAIHLRESWMLGFDTRNRAGRRPDQARRHESHLKSLQRAEEKHAKSILFEEERVQ
jgi:hypothetical protein